MKNYKKPILINKTKINLFSAITQGKKTKTKKTQPNLQSAVLHSVTTLNSAKLFYWLTVHKRSDTAAAFSNQANTKRQRFLSFGAEATCNIWFIPHASVVIMIWLFTGKSDFGSNSIKYFERMKSFAISAVLPSETRSPQNNINQTWIRMENRAGNNDFFAVLSDSHKMDIH